MSLTAGNALVYDGTLSLKVISLPALPNVQMLTAFNDANEVLLHNVLMQDETHEHDDHDEVMVELRRQDTKLRLIAELLGMLLMQQQLVPPQIRVRFSGEELAAPASDLPTLAVGSWVRCELYVDPATPKPLVLHAEVSGIQSSHVADGIDESWLYCRLQGLSSNVQDCIEKLVFRQHRRSVAQQRRLIGPAQHL